MPLIPGTVEEKQRINQTARPVPHASFIPTPRAAGKRFIRPTAANCVAELVYSNEDVFAITHPLNRLYFFDSLRRRNSGFSLPALGHTRCLMRHRTRRV